MFSGQFESVSADCLKSIKVRFGGHFVPIRSRGRVLGGQFESPSADITFSANGFQSLTSALVDTLYQSVRMDKYLDGTSNL